MIEIKDKSGKLRHSTACNEGCVYRKTLMREDCIVLKFSVPEPILFHKADYVETEFGRFELVDLVFPTENRSTGGYDYELRLDAPYYKWKNKKLFYTRQGSKEKSWSLTGFMEMHLQVVLDNLKALGYLYKENPETPYALSVHPEVEKSAKVLSYDNTNILDALSRIAEAWDCEWWVVDQFIHFGQCEYNAAVCFEINKEVTEMSRSDTNSTYATRIYAFGSTRNLPSGYRPSEAGLVVEGVVEKRLMLPVREGYADYIDAYPAMLSEEVVEDVVVFEDVYPQRTGHVSDVSFSKVSELDSEGKDTGKTLYAYSIKDATLPNFSSTYILPGIELRAVFQSGLLAGMDFALTLKSSDASGTLFEVNRNDTYGITLPNDLLKPSSGDGGKIPADTYVLYGYDTQFVDQHLVSLAEAELLKKAQAHVEKSKLDSSVYTCKMNPVRISGTDGSQPLDLLLGDRVQLINPTYFEGIRESRIFGFEKRLDHTCEVTYTVGQSTQYSRIGELENKIKELTYQGQTYTGGNGGVYVIGRYDKTIATDRNVFSTLRSMDLFLNKTRPDTAKEPVSFLKGLTAGSVFVKSPLTRGDLEHQISAALFEEGTGDPEVMSLSLMEEVEAMISYEYGKLAYIGGTYSNDTDPITQSLGDHHLAEQRWITKRIIYMMSKYSFGLFSASGTDTITVRAAGNTIKYQLTPAIDLYPAISNGTSIIRGARTQAGEVCEMEIELSGSGDQQNSIQGASYLQDIGSWHDKNVSGSMIVQGRMLREIHLGSKTEPILISISSLTISNCISLQRLILSNIVSLSGTLSLATCTHLQEVYADGTSLVQLRLPSGGGLRVVEFSAFNQYLTLQNYPLLTNEGVGIALCKGRITDFFVVDCPKMQPMMLLSEIIDAQVGQANHALKRVRAVGFDETYHSSDILDKLATLADGSYIGLSSDGLAGEDELPVLDGRLNVFANAYTDSIEALKNTFKKMLLNVIGKRYVRFKSNVIEKTLASMHGDGVGLTMENIESVQSLSPYNNLFKENKQITSFDEFIHFKAVSTIGYGTFEASSITSIMIPRNVIEISRASFSYSDLSNIIFEDGDLPLRIYISVVNGCKLLKRLVLPARLISWDSYTVRDSGIEIIYIKATTPPVLGKGWGDNYHLIDLFVPIGCKAIYQAATNWDQFKTITEYDFELNQHNVH